MATDETPRIHIPAARLLQGETTLTIPANVTLWGSDMSVIEDALAALWEEPPSQTAQAGLQGYLCETCLDASAVQLVPAPWGGDMGICDACHDRQRLGAQARARRAQRRQGKSRGA